MFNIDDLYFVNLMFIILILFINTILTVYVLNRLRKLETEVALDELLLDAVSSKVGLSFEDVISEYEDDEDEDYVNGEIKEYDEDDYIN